MKTSPGKILIFLSHLIPVEYSRAGVKSQVLPSSPIDCGYLMQHLYLFPSRLYDPMHVCRLNTSDLDLAGGHGNLFTSCQKKETYK